MKKILVVLLFVVFAYCANNYSTEVKVLPSEAYNITDIGNGWSTFELDGNKFLYHRGYAGHEAITQIR